MAIQLHPELHVGAVPSDNGWTIVAEHHGREHVHLVAVDEHGAPRGFIRFRASSVPALVELLLAASESG